MCDSNDKSLSTVNSILGYYAGFLAEMFTEKAKDLMANFESVKDIGFKDSTDMIKEGLDLAGEAITAYTIFKKAYELPTRLFLTKFERYCKGLIDIPMQDRAAYFQRVDQQSRDSETLFILGVINKIEEIEKIDIMLALFKAKLYDDINDATYRRLIVMAGNTLYSDLCYMGKNITQANFPIKDDEQDGLLGSGWIRPVGQGWGTIGDTESDNLFAYNEIAKCFCNIVFQSKIEELPPAKAMFIKVKNIEEITT